MTVANLGASSPIRTMLLLDHAANVHLQVAVSQITRSGSVATVKAKRHGFATGETITIAGTGQSEYNISAAITVVDDDTFTYTVSGTPASPATVAVSGGITASNPASSRIAPGCSAVQVEVPAVGTTLKVEKRLYFNAPWVQEGSDITSASTAAQAFVSFTVPVAFVRVRRSAGAGNCKAYAQTVVG